VSDRKDILLRAAYDLIKSSTQDFYVRETVSIFTRYDDANCDGYCLMDDIALELGLEDGTDPIPLVDYEPDSDKEVDNNERNQ
jgi:hypothetical protein